MLIEKGYANLICVLTERLEPSFQGRETSRLPIWSYLYFHFWRQLPWGRHWPFWTTRWLFSGWGETKPCGRTALPMRDFFFFCLGLVLAFSASQVNLEKTGIHPPRAGSHPVFKATCTIIQKSNCLLPFWQEPRFFPLSFCFFVPFT